MLVSLDSIKCLSVSKSDSAQPGVVASQFALEGAWDERATGVGVCAGLVFCKYRVF
jgi:hypothetical protein